jgi:hypothetical protein
MTNIIPISASSWVPLSATYPYDSNIKIKNVIANWEDGYSMFEQEAFNNGADISLNKETIFYLPSSKSLFDFIEESDKDNVYHGIYCIISIDPGSSFNNIRQYISVQNDTDLYLNTVSSNNSFFRFVLNDDDTFSLLHGNGLYATVDSVMPYSITLQDKLSETERERQRFIYQVIDSRIFFSIRIRDPFSGNYMQRRWSYFKAGPEKGKICAGSYVSFTDYVSSGGSFINNYLFNISNFDIYYKPTGLITDHTWVKYYNSLEDATHNKDVEVYIPGCISGVRVSHLFDLPYNTQIDIANKSVSVNFANLKNIMTSEYEYKTDSADL